MKRIIVITLVLITTGQLTFALGGKDGKIGIRAGYQAAAVGIDGSQAATTAALNTFYVGAFKEKQIIPLLHFGSGLEYFQNGFESTAIDMQRKLHYLSVPLYLKVKVGPIYATGGTGLNFKVAENNILLGESTEVTEKSKVFDMPLQVGLGVKILMLSIEAKYHWGLIELNDLGYKNQYLQLGLTVSF